MTFDVTGLARLLSLPESTVRGWLARVDLPFAKRLGQGRSRITFAISDAFALALMRDLIAFGVAVRDASAFAERIVTRAGAPPENLIAIVAHGDEPVLEMISAVSMPRIDAGARLIVPLLSLWNEVVGASKA